ncbi:MAG: c-type cytochrome [Candidatus Sulfotelmatobacter sp.]
MQSSKNSLSSLWQTLFGHPVRAFGVVSLLLLISLAIAPAKNYFSEWRHYQSQYLTLIRSRGDAVTLQRHFHGGIQQIWLPQLGVVDRCTTCHVGLKEASLADVSAQPFRRHPVIPHTLDQFGCVMCHRGQGPATTVEEAHRSTLAWEQPTLPARFVQSSCGQCHRAPLTGTPQLNLGRNLLARYGCVHCHTIKLPDGSAIRPTDDPPSLEHIADKSTREWIYAWLKDPQAYAVTATMPNFKLSDPDARDISAFLIANSTPIPGDTVPAAKDLKAPDPTAGASLYGESFCASCHAVENAAGNVVGGNVGPELTRIGNKVKPEWLRAWLRNPRVYDSGTAMPHYRFTDKQVSLLTAFLGNKTDSDLLAKVHLDAPTPEQIAHGKLLVTEYGCASCHEIGGIKKPDNFAPELTRVGSRPLTQISFLPGMPHTVPDYISAKIRQPRSFGSALKMPQYTFAPAEADALTTALLSLTDRALDLPRALTVPAQPPSTYQPAGKAGQLMADLACFSCHAINGRGSDMAPDLSWEGSSVQRPWLQAFLKNPGTLRPALIRRMPRFNLSDSEVTELTNYIMTVYQTPAFDRDSMPSSGYPPTQVEQGRQLFYSKYACQSCHIVDTKVDKGYIGPTLTEVGSRLNAAWIYHWLKDPQATRPGTIEPNRNMNDEDARALTAFLMTLKSSARQEAKK